MDAGQRPAPGVLLHLDGRSGEQRWQRRDTTDLAGQVRFEQVAHDFGSAREDELRVSVQLPMTEVVEARLARLPPPGTPVRLQLPPLGSVEVRVLDATGAPAEDLGAAVDLQSPPTGERVPVSSLRAWSRADLVEGRVLFPRVGLNLELELSTWSQTEAARTVVLGPRAAGERVTAVLRLVVEGTVLRFRALDPERAPLAGQLFVTTRSSSNHASQSTSTTMTADEEGFFEVSVESRLPEGEQRTLDVSARDGELRASADLSRSFPPGRIEMGDLLLSRQDVIAAGRVIDDLGQPVGSASIGWEPADGHETDADSWAATRSGATTDGNGAFVLRGSAAAPRVELRGHHRKVHVLPVEVATGATDVEIRAERMGGMRGAVLLDPGVPAASLVVEIQAQGSSDARAEQLVTYGESSAASNEGRSLSWSERGERLQPRSDGRFMAKRLVPGSYTVAVVSGRAVLAEVTDLLVAPGEVNQDARIQAIDLRGRLRVFRLELVPPAPEFPLTGSLRYVESGSSGAEHALSFQDQALLEWVTPLARLDATVRVAGCRLERLRDLAPTTRVQLRAGFPVQLALPADVGLPGSALAIGVSIVEEDATDYAVHFFDERGETRLHVSEPGRYPLQWFVERRSKTGRLRTSLGLASPGFVEIGDEPGGQRVVLALSNEGLRAALDAR